MSFFYDNLSGLSGLAQYEKYLENNFYIRNLKRYTDDPLNYQLFEIKRTICKDTSTSIDNASFIANESKKHFDDLSIAICGTLEKGFDQVLNELEDINWRLNDLNEGVDKLHSLLDWKTDIIIEGQKISNLYLGKMTDLLKIPDSQKQRSYHVEQGITWLKNAIDEGPKSDFYSDALDEFMKAKQIEEKDYFSLSKIGLIHLNSKKHLDIRQADLYFKSSARYAKAIANASPSSSAKSQRRYNEKLESLLTKEILLEQAASSLNYASRCNYIQTNFSEAIHLAKQAIELHSTNPEYSLQLAKCLSANEQGEEAADVIEKAIEFNKYYSLKVLSDPDLFNNKYILKRISSMTNILIAKVDKEIEHLRSILIPNSALRSELQEVVKKYNPKSYITARIASERLF